MSKAVLISVDVAGRGKVEVVDWQDKPGLSEHYAAIECDLVQIAGVGKFGGVPVVMFVDEEGLLRNEVLLNLTACDFLAEATKSAPAYLMGGGLVGRALVLFDEGSDSRGFTEADGEGGRAVEQGWLSGRALSRWPRLTFSGSRV